MIYRYVVFLVWWKFPYDAGSFGGLQLSHEVSGSWATEDPNRNLDIFPLGKRSQVNKNAPTKRTPGGFLKWWYPQIIHFTRVFHYKSSILGYPYFWKHPVVPQPNFLLFNFHHPSGPTKTSSKSHLPFFPHPFSVQLCPWRFHHVFILKMPFGEQHTM